MIREIASASTPTIERDSACAGTPCQVDVTPLGGPGTEVTFTVVAVKGMRESAMSSGTGNTSISFGYRPEYE